MKITCKSLFQFSKSAVVIALLTLAVACKPAATSNSFDLAAAKTEIEAVNQKFAELANQRDSVGIANECYTADAKFFMANGPIIEGRNNIQSAFAAMINANKGGKVNPATTTEIWGDENTITEEGIYLISKADGSINDQGKYLIVWKKEDGKWKIYRDCSNSDLPAVAAN